MIIFETCIEQLFFFGTFVKRHSQDFICYVLIKFQASKLVKIGAFSLWLRMKFDMKHIILHDMPLKIHAYFTCSSHTVI